MRTIAANDGTLEPVTLPETKSFIRSVSGDIEDARLRLMIRAARRAVEEFARISVVHREWTTVYRPPEFRSFGVGYEGSWHDPDNVRQSVYLPRRPVTAVNDVTIRYDNGNSEDIKLLTNFDADMGRLRWNAGSYDRAIGSGTGVSLIVKYDAGFLALPNGEDDPLRTDAPEEIRLAVLQTVQHYYESRELGTSKAIPAIARQHLQGWFQSASVS